PDAIALDAALREPPAPARRPLGLLIAGLAAALGAAGLAAVGLAAIAVTSWLTPGPEPPPPPGPRPAAVDRWWSSGARGVVGSPGDPADAAVLTSKGWVRWEKGSGDVLLGQTKLNFGGVDGIVPMDGGLGLTWSSSPYVWWSPITSEDMV